MSVIAVFGGSFDPLTLAHEAIIRHALRDLNASMGILIPCSDEYIQAKKGCLPMFSAAKRLLMLESAFEGDPEITADPRETLAASPEGRSLVSMRELSLEHPSDRLIFVTGADKLETLPRWGGGMFLKEFGAAVYPRHGVTPESTGGVVMLPAIKEAAGISSGVVRDAIKSGRDISALVSPAVYQIIKGTDFDR